MEFVQLASYGNYVEANIALSMLQEEGINCHLLYETTATLINTYGGMRLMVYASQTERAKELLKNVEIEFLKTLECPQCHNHGFKLKYVTIDVGNFLPRLVRTVLNLISKDETKAQIKHYVCDNCNKEFEDLPL